MAESSYLDALNPEQREAVLTLEGPVLIVAGAGSGKTRVLTYRIAHFLAQGISPNSILALTFTNKAAREMKSRIQQVVGEDLTSRLYMGTFHSIFMRLLREEAQTLGYGSNFTVYDPNASIALINRIVRDKNLDKDLYKGRDIFGIISRCKNDLILPSAYQANEKFRKADAYMNRPRVGEIYLAYWEAMRQNNAMDFDDLLVNTHLLFHEHPEILSHYQDRFTYIMVDEFQDTNEVQNNILNLLAQRHRNLCVVGDDAQSIYAFRGARVQNILGFTSLYPEAKTIKLITNYRSTSAIVSAANLLISYNPNQIPKECKAAQGAGASIRPLNPSNENEEALRIANNIKERAQREQAPYKDFAILYRTSAQSRVVEAALRRLNIPYRVYGGMSFYTRKEIMDLMAYFNFVLNPSDNDTLARIINLPTRGIGEKAQSVLFREALQNHVSVWSYIESLPRQDSELQNAAQSSICAFREMLSPFITKVSNENAYHFAAELFQVSGLEALYKADKSPEGEARCQNLAELFHAIREYEEEHDSKNPDEQVTIGMFMEEAALLTDADQKDKENANSVTLTTIHSSKGLEFNHVYLIGVEEGLFPSQRSLEEENGLEEERRLCYVAVTRAAKSLTVSSCASRKRFSNKPSSTKPSRFLLELLGKEQYNSVFRKRDTWGDAADFHSEEPLIHIRNTQDRQTGVRNLEPQRERRTSILNRNIETRYSPNNSSARRAIPSTPPITHFSDLVVGDKIYHPIFGNGVILSFQGEGYDKRASIKFSDGSIRTLILKLAKLQKIDG